MVRVGVVVIECGCMFAIGEFLAEKCRGWSLVGCGLGVSLELYRIFGGVLAL